MMCQIKSIQEMCLEGINLFKIYGTTNTKVEFSVFLNAEGVPTYMMVFVPNK